MDPAIALISVIVTVLVSILVISGIIVLYKTYIVKPTHTDQEELNSRISLPTLPEEMENTNSSSLTIADEGEVQGLYRLTGIGSSVRTSRGTDLDTSCNVHLTGEQPRDDQGDISNNCMVHEAGEKINLNSSTIVEENEEPQSCRVEDIESSRRSSSVLVHRNPSVVQITVAPSIEHKGKSNNTSMESSEHVEPGDSTDNQEDQKVPYFGSAINVKENIGNEMRSDSLVQIDVDRSSINKEIGSLLKEEEEGGDCRGANSDFRNGQNGRHINIQF